MNIYREASSELTEEQIRVTYGSLIDRFLAALTADVETLVQMAEDGEKLAAGAKRIRKSGRGPLKHCKIIPAD